MDPSLNGLKASLRLLCGHFSEALILRGRLASSELSYERQRVLSLLLWFTAVVFGAGMSAIMATLLVVILLWESHGLLVMGSFLAAYLLITLIASACLLRKLRRMPPVLEQTLAVLEEDYRGFTEKGDRHE